MPLATLVLTVLAALAGAFIPIQTGYDVELARALRSPLVASTAVVLVGAAGLAIASLATSQPCPARGEEAAVPAPAWTAGGPLAATHVVILSLAAPVLGSATTVVLVVPGQILCSLAIDHLGLLNFPVHAMTWPRAAGVALLVAGVGLIEVF